jgi:hypothetical protein
LEWVENPEEHLEILRLLSKVAWITKHKWPIQKLLSRAQDRDRHKLHFASIDDLEERANARAQCDPMATIPFLAIPNTPISTLKDDEYGYLQCARLSRRQPSTISLGAQCTCPRKTAIGKGRHCRTCMLGGGIGHVHNCVRDRSRAMCANAGVTARTEEPNLMPGGGQQKPADVFAIGIGTHGRDVAIDTTIVSTTTAGMSIAALRRRGKTVGLAARQADKKKRDKTHNGGGARMVDRLDEVGVEFIAMGFETSGAQGSGFRTFLKRLSECAVQRRGHDPGYFVRRWKVDIAMTIAKRGAQAAIRRAHEIGVEQRYGFGAVDIEGDDGAPLGAEYSELPLLAGGG